MGVDVEGIERPGAKPPAIHRQANAVRLSTLEQQVVDGKAMNAQLQQVRLPGLCATAPSSTSASLVSASSWGWGVGGSSSSRVFCYRR